MASGIQYTPFHYAFGYDGVDDESDIGSDYEDLMASPPSSPIRMKELDEEGAKLDLEALLRDWPEAKNQPYNYIPMKQVDLG